MFKNIVLRNPHSSPLVLRFSCSIFFSLFLCVSSLLLELQRPLLPELQQHQTDELRQNIRLLQVMLYV